MRVGRPGGFLLAVHLVLGVLLGTLFSTAGPASAGTGGAPPPPPAPDRPWTFGGQPCRLLSTVPTTPSASAAAMGAPDANEACPGVRPGASVLTPVGQCTLNFLWHGSDGRDYIGTAGHCLLEGSNQTQAVYRPGTGPPARDSAGRPIGEFAYGALDRVSDFALIRLDRGVNANPAICRFGGPTGFAAEALPVLTPLQHVGRGSLTGSFSPARTQLAVDSAGPRLLTGLGLASAGDSGSPVVGVDGRAVGVLVATGPFLPLLPGGVLVFSVRIGPEMARAGTALGLAFDLVTAPLSTNLLQP
jgi:hypothetical protein